MEKCFKSCQGHTQFCPAPLTKDGKLTSYVLCEAGIVGGCEGPGTEEVEKINQEAGRVHGRLPATPPLQTDSFGRPITNRW